MSGTVELLHYLKKISAQLERLAVRTNRTISVEVDLSVARTDEPLNLEVPGRTYRWLTVERCDGSLTYKLKQTDGSLSNSFTAYRGSSITNHDFLDVVVSNPAGAGICRFVVGYYEE